MSKTGFCLFFLLFAAQAHAQPANLVAMSRQASATALPETSIAAVSGSSSLHGVLVGLEGGTDLVLTERYQDEFDNGYHGILRVGLAFTRSFAVQTSLGNWWFPAQDGPVGRLVAVQLGVRAKFPLFRGMGGGPVVDGNAGLGFTGDLKRVVFDAGVGWEFPLTDWFALGPVVRYAQIVQPETEPVGDDARYFLLAVGLNARWPLDRAAPARRRPELVDSDKDGIFDPEDKCPSEPEDKDQFEDEDGCPETDNDQDGVADADDQCPSRAEVRNGFQDEDGCPDETPPAVAEALAPPEAKLLPERVHFETGKARIRASFRKEIKAVCEHMQQNPGQRIRVLGHADETGSAASNTRLAARRASLVTSFMIEHCKLPAERLEIRAFGATKRLCTESSKECRQQNRRVAFEVLDAQE